MALAATAPRRAAYLAVQRGVRTNLATVTVRIGQNLPFFTVIAHLFVRACAGWRRLHQHARWQLDRRQKLPALQILPFGRWRAWQTEVH